MASKGIADRGILTVLWRIENLSYWDPEFHGRDICSKPFNTQFRKGNLLRVFPKGIHEDDPRLHVFLDFNDDFGNIIDCEWSLLDDVGSTLFTTSRNRRTNRRTFIKHDDVFVTRRSSFLPLDTLTVLCRIWKSDLNFEQAEHISALSRLKGSEKSFAWRIETFSSLQLGSSCEDAVGNLEIGSDVTNFQHLTLKVSILKEEKEMKCWERQYTFNNKQIISLSRFVSKKQILERKCDWLCGDDLNLLCKFVVVQKDIDQLIETTYCGPANLKIDIPRHNPSIHKNDRTASTQTELNPRNNASMFVEASTQTTHQSGDDISQCKGNSSAVLLDDFLTLYKDQTLFDFELRSGDVSFPVHKYVLIARSPVFRAMFCGEMRDPESSSLDVPDVDANTLNRMLTFLYSGTVDDLQWEDVAKLYYAADKYQVLSLKKECTAMLRSVVVTVSNVSDILELADRHQDQELTSFVCDFILLHYDEIILSGEWEEFMLRNSYLAGKTMIEVYKRKLQK